MLQSLENDSVDAKYGFDRVKDGMCRTGWLLNVHPVCPLDLRILGFDFTSVHC